MSTYGSGAPTEAILILLLALSGTGRRWLVIRITLIEINLLDTEVGSDGPLPVDRHSQFGGLQLLAIDANDHLATHRQRRFEHPAQDAYLEIAPRGLETGEDDQRPRSTRLALEHGGRGAKVVVGRRHADVKL